jgi:hypothetical protein
VFFDLPHPPWCPHEDRCIPYLIRYLKDVQGQPIAAIRGMVEAYARERVRVPEILTPPVPEILALPS